MNQRKGRLQKGRYPTLTNGEITLETDEETFEMLTQTCVEDYSSDNICREGR